MRIATWNVNSLRARQQRVEAWLAENEPDVCCLQETKCDDDAFPSMAFAALGYEAAHHGSGRWNGVAILSRVGLSEVRAGFSTPLGSPGGEEGSDEARQLSATCSGVHVAQLGADPAPTPAATAAAKPAAAAADRKKKSTCRDGK